MESDLGNLIEAALGTKVDRRGAIAGLSAIAATAVTGCGAEYTRQRRIYDGDYDALSQLDFHCVGTVDTEDGTVEICKADKTIPDDITRYTVSRGGHVQRETFVYKSGYYIQNVLHVIHEDNGKNTQYFGNPPYFFDGMSMVTRNGQKIYSSARNLEESFEGYGISHNNVYPILSDALKKTEEWKELLSYKQAQKRALEAGVPAHLTR